MKFGLMFFAASEDTLHGDKYNLVIESARYADQHQFNSIWVPERHFTEFGGLYPSPSILNAALARETEQIRLRAGSVVVPLHNAIRIAEEWSMVDNLSNGRVDVSIASGWNPNDFAFYPDRYQNRHQIMLDNLNQIQALWRGESIEITNGVGKPARINMYPSPIQPQLPIWVTAAGNPRTFTNAGQMGANILTHILDQTVEELAEKIALYRQARAQAGHDPDAGVVSVMLHTFVGNDEQTIRELARKPYCNYIKSNFGLLKGLAKSRGQDFDVTKLSPEDLDEFVNFLYERFASTRGLIGTPETCQPLIEQLTQIGVGEVACLLDFGPSEDLILNHLPYLNQLRSQYDTTSTATDEPVAIHSTIAPSPITKLQAHLPQKLSRFDFYNQLQQYGVQFGTRFQGIQKIWYSETEALGQIELPASLLNEHQQYYRHPALLDACFQVIVATLMTDNQFVQNALYMPVGMKEVQIHGRLTQNVWSHAKLQTPLQENQTAYTGDVQILDEQGQLILSVTGLRLQRIDGFSAPTAHIPASWLYQLQWQASDSPLSLPQRQQTASHCILFADQSGVAESVAEQLRPLNITPVLVYSDKMSSRLNPNSYWVDPQNPEAMQDFVQQVMTRQTTPCQGVLYFWGLDTNDNSHITPSSLQEDLDKTVLGALHLTQALAHHQPTPTWFVTQGALALGETAQPIALSQAPLWGWARTLPLEHPDCWGGLIDLDPQAEHDEMVNQLLSVIWQEDGEDQILLRDGKQHLLRLINNADGLSLDTSYQWQEDGTYLITGGLGSLGFSMAQHLVANGVKNLVLTGRSTPKAEIQAQLDEMTAQGVRVWVAAVDVADSAGMNNLFQQLQAEWPPLRGVCHLAGVTAYETMSEITAVSLRNLVAPKIQGTWILYQLCQALSLDFFLQISSLSPVWGTKGLSHYAAANFFQDMFAYNGRYHHFPVSTINVGPMGGGGMASANDAISDVMTGAGLNLLPPEQVITALEKLLQAGVTRQILAEVDWRTFKPLYNNNRQHPLLDTITLELGNASPVLEATEQYKQLARLSAQERLLTMTELLQHIIASVMKLADGELPHAERGFFDMGMDSLMILELKSRLQRELGCTLSATLAFEYATIEALATHLSSHLFPQTAEDVSEDIPSNTDEEEVDEALSEIQQLSQAELEALVASELEALIK